MTVYIDIRFNSCKSCFVGVNMIVDLVAQSMSSCPVSTLSEDFIYPHCSRKYKYKPNLTAHLQKECGVTKKFQCRICSRACAQKSHLKSHMIWVHKNIAI